MDARLTMPANRIRWIAWTAALAGVALLALSERSPTKPAHHLEPTPASPLSPEPPELFRIAGPLEAISAPAAMAAGETIVEPRQRPILNSLTIRDPGSFTGTVIREPGSASRAPQGYVLREPTAERPQPLPQLPIELLLNEPKREEAPVAPRAADRIPSETKFGAPPSPLPMLNTANPAMHPVNDQARVHVQRGFSLGDRSAIFAARTEFIQALRTVAQAVDAQAGLAPNDSESCSQALSRGLHALTEADDFAPEGSRLDGDLDLAAIIAGHRTPACKADPPTTQLAALQAYFDYARDQLARAAAGNPVSSQALAGLGKSYTVGADQRLANAKAMVFHQAAAVTDGANHLASNELGVLLARYGQWEQAKQSLLASLRVQPDANAWQNLAAVHARLGESDLAALADQERKLLLAGTPNVYSAVDGSPTVQWVDPKAFAGPPEEALASPPAMKPGSTPSTAQNSDPWSWLPWR